MQRSVKNRPLLLYLLFVFGGHIIIFSKSVRGRGYIVAALSRYRVTSGEYSRFSKAVELPQQRARVTVDGLGNVGVGKWKKRVDSSGESGIIKSPRYYSGTGDKVAEFSSKLKSVSLLKNINPFQTNIFHLCKKNKE